ncbi:MAG: hypothetical protein ACTSO9_20265 [Candidatus Helarchaeota archaeon]
MSQKCKELEEKAKNIGNNPVLAKEIYLELANCYEETHQTKKANKAYENVAKILFNTAAKFEDPEEARKLYEEAHDYYKKIKKSKECLKCKKLTAESYINAAKRLYNTKKRMIYAIKYLNTANNILEDLKEKDRITQNKQFINLIQEQIGLPIEEINSILEEYPKPVIIREPPILEAREFERRKKELEQKALEEAKRLEKQRKLEEKKLKEEQLAIEKKRIEEEQKYKKEVLSKLVQEGKTADEIKEYKESLEKFEKEEKSQLSTLDALLKKKES